MKERFAGKSMLHKILAVVLAVAVWQAIAMLIHNRLLLASPYQVFIRLIALVQESDFFPTIGYSSLRIIAGFFAGLLLGILLALLSGRWSIIRTLLSPYMTAIKTVPVASFIVIALIWFSAGGLSIFIAFLMTLPVVYSNLLSGLLSRDVKKEEMAKVFGIPYFRKLFYIDLPQLKTPIMTACQVSIGMAWKAGIAAEVIGIPGGSIGEALYQAKIYLATEDLLAWTVTLVLVSVLFEKIVTGLLHFALKGMEKIR